MKGKWKNSLKLFLYQEANIQEQGHYGCLVMPNNKTPSQHSFGARKERPQEKHQRDFIKKRALRTREARKVGNDPNWLSAEGVSETCSQKAARFPDMAFHQRTLTTSCGQLPLPPDPLPFLPASPFYWCHIKEAGRQFSPLTSSQNNL